VYHDNNPTDGIELSDCTIRYEEDFHRLYSEVRSSNVHRVAQSQMTVYLMGTKA